MNRSRHRPGFTLIELIVVLVILAILAAAGLPALSGYIKSARETTAISECGTVVRTAQAKAVELMAFERLDELGTQVQRDAIMEACGLPGELRGVTADTVSGSVSYLLYQAKNGLLVQYKAEDDPKFTIVQTGGGGTGPSLPTGPMENLIAKTKDHMKDQKPTKREDLSNWVMAEENRVEVDSEYLQNWPSSAKGPFYWRPYYLTDPQNNILFLFAGPVSTSNSWNGWASFFFYIDGKVYRHPDGISTGIASFNKCTTLAEVESRVISAGFELVTD